MPGTALASSFNAAMAERSNCNARFAYNVEKSIFITCLYIMSYYITEYHRTIFAAIYHIRR